MENKNIQKTTAAESSDIFAVAEDQDKKNAAIDYAAFVMQLARPLVHDDKTYTELTFNFEGLSGNDSLAIERELQMLGHTVIVANFDSEYLIRVCVKACTENLGPQAVPRHGADKQHSGRFLAISPARRSCAVGEVLQRNYR